MTANLIELDADYARLSNQGWRIFGQPLVWWARHDRCQQKIDANCLTMLFAACDAHELAGCSDTF